MHLDLETIMIASALVITLMAVLFVVDALSRPLDAVGRIWSLGFMSGALACYAFLGTTVNELALGGTALGTATMVLALTSIWSGARRFGGRRPFLWIVLAVPVACCLAVLARWQADGIWAGAELMFAAIAVFALLTAAECLRRPVRSYGTARMLCLGTFLGGLYYIVRLAVYLVVGREDPIFTQYFGTEITTIAIMLLVVTAGTSMIAMRGEEARQALFHGATQDSLTGAATPAAFRTSARLLLQRFEQTESFVALVVGDLDQTTDTNIAVGRSYVDRTLQQFVSVLTEMLPAGTLIGREVGDRFCVLLTDTTAEEAAEHAQEVRTLMESKPLVVADPSVRMTASFGVCSSETGGYDIEGLVNKATRAMQTVKRQGGNGVVVSQEEAPISN